MNCSKRKRQVQKYSMVYTGHRAVKGASRVHFSVTSQRQHDDYRSNVKTSLGNKRLLPFLSRY